jgi:hypothetical protein
MYLKAYTFRGKIVFNLIEGKSKVIPVTGRVGP